MGRDEGRRLGTFRARANKSYGGQYNVTHAEYGVSPLLQQPYS